MRITLLAALCLALWGACTGEAHATELERLYLLTTGSHEATLDAELARFTGRVLERLDTVEFAGDQAMEQVYANCAEQLGTDALTQRECRLRAANRIMVTEVLELGGRRLGQGRYELTLQVWSPESNGQRFASVLEHEADSLELAARQGLPTLAERYLCWRGDDAACAAARVATTVSPSQVRPAPVVVESAPSTEGGGLVIDASGTRSFARVLRDHEAQCEVEGEACFSLARAHIRGELGLAANPVAAVPWLERGCERSHGESCYVLADGYRLGEVVAEDRGLRVGYLELGCDAGHQLACDELGAAVVARAAELDGEARTLLLERACARSVAAACTLHGAGLVDTDAAAAHEVLATACELGDGAGCHHLGVALLDGVGGNGDPDLAYLALERGCETLEDADACVAMGTMVENHQGPAKTLDVAVAAHELACQQDHPEGCWRLGNVHQRIVRFEGGTRRWKVTRAWDKACDLGRIEACLLLGQFYIDEGDDLAAWEPIRKACTRGDDASCEALEVLAVEIRRWTRHRR